MLVLVVNISWLILALSEFQLSTTRVPIGVQVGDNLCCLLRVSDVNESHEVCDVKHIHHLPQRHTANHFAT